MDWNVKKEVPCISQESARPLWEQFNAPMLARSEDETWYVVDCEFLDLLGLLATHGISSNAEESGVSPEELPLKIRNRDLLAKPFRKLPRATKLSLLDDSILYAQGDRYELVNEKFWRALTAHFDFDIEIPRRVYRDGRRLKIEAQPLSLPVYLAAAPAAAAAYSKCANDACMCTPTAEASTAGGDGPTSVKAAASSAITAAVLGESGEEQKAAAAAAGHVQDLKFFSLGNLTISRGDNVADARQKLSALLNDHHVDVSDLQFFRAVCSKSSNSHVEFFEYEPLEVASNTSSSTAAVAVADQKPAVVSACTKKGMESNKGETLAERGLDRDSVIVALPRATAAAAVVLKKDSQCSSRTSCCHHHLHRSNPDTAAVMASVTGAAELHAAGVVRGSASCEKWTNNNTKEEKEICGAVGSCCTRRFLSSSQQKTTPAFASPSDAGKWSLQKNEQQQQRLACCCSEWMAAAEEEVEKRSINNNEMKSRVFTRGIAAEAAAVAKASQSAEATSDGSSDGEIQRFSCSLPLQQQFLREQGASTTTTTTTAALLSCSPAAVAAAECRNNSSNVILAAAGASLGKESAEKMCCSSSSSSERLLLLRGGGEPVDSCCGTFAAVAAFQKTDAEEQKQQLHREQPRKLFPVSMVAAPPARNNTTAPSSISGTIVVGGGCRTDVEGPHQSGALLHEAEEAACCKSKHSKSASEQLLLLRESRRRQAAAGLLPLKLNDAAAAAIRPAARLEQQQQQAATAAAEEKEAAEEEENETDARIIYRTGGLCGLINLGNTCFLNSAIQCLSKVLPLTYYFLSDQYLADLNEQNVMGTQGRLARAYCNTLRELWFGGDSALAPRELKWAVGRVREEFLGFNQQDSQEFIAFLLDGLHEDLNRVRQKPYYESKIEGGPEKSDAEVAELSWRRHLEVNDSFLVDFFQGMYRSRLHCPQCGKVSRTFDPFMYLSLPVPPAAHIDSSLVFSISFTSSVDVEAPAAVPRTFRFERRLAAVDYYAAKHAYIEFIGRLLSPGGHALGPGGREALINCGLASTQLKDLSLLAEENILMFIKRPDDGSSADGQVEVFCRGDSISPQFDRRTSHIYAWLMPAAVVQEVEGRNREEELEEEEEGENSLPRLLDHSSVGTTKTNCCSLYLGAEQSEERSPKHSPGDTERGPSEDVWPRSSHSSCDDDSSCTSSSDRSINNIGAAAIEAVAEGDNSSSSCRLLERQRIMLPTAAAAAEGAAVSEGDAENGRIQTSKDAACYRPSSAEATAAAGLQLATEQQGNVGAVQQQQHRLKKRRSNSVTLRRRSLAASSTFFIFVLPISKPFRCATTGDRSTTLRCWLMPLLLAVSERSTTCEDFYRRVEGAYGCETAKSEKLETTNSDEALAADCSNNRSSSRDRSRCGEGVDAAAAIGDDDSADEAADEAPTGLLSSGGSHNNSVRRKESSTPPPAQQQRSLINHAVGLIRSISGHNEPAEKTSAFANTHTISLFVPAGYSLQQQEEQQTAPRCCTGNSMLSQGVSLLTNGIGRKAAAAAAAAAAQPRLLPDDNIQLLSSWLRPNPGEYVAVVYADLSALSDAEKIGACETVRRMGALMPSPSVDISDCLRRFSEQERLDQDNMWYCGSCKEHVQALKKLDLWKIPRMLILHLKRFHNVSRWNRSKISTPVTFPYRRGEYLDMTPYILSESLQLMHEQDPNFVPLYELVSVNVHSGDLGGGHYYAYAKLRGRWYEFNDSWIQAVGEDTCQTPDAYMLFYRLKQDEAHWTGNF